MWSARHLLDVDVAVKLLRVELAGRAAGFARFEQEARMTARIKHLHVVSVIDYGTFGEGA